MNQFCVSCNGSLPDHAIYCPSCGHLSRCGHCQTILVPGAGFCIACGTRIDQTGQSATGGQNASASSAVNWLKYEETETGRSLEARFTDVAVTGLSAPIANALIGHDDMSLIKLGPEVTPIEELSPNVLPLVPGDQRETSGVVGAIGSSVPAIDGDDRQLINRVFRRDGDTLKLDRSELKGESKTENVRRLVYLVLYARELEGVQSVTKAELRDVVSDAGLYDGNMTRVYQNVDDLSVDGDEVRLRATGRDLARKFLADVFDSTKDAPRLSSFGRRSKSTTSKEADGDQGVKTSRSKQRKASKRVQELIGMWNASSKKIDGHAILSDSTVADKGLLGLWAIRQIAGEEGKTVTSADLAMFIQLAFEHKVSERGLRLALEKSGKAMNPTGTMFHITPTGLKHVNEMIAKGAAATNKPSEDAAT